MSADSGGRQAGPPRDPAHSAHPEQRLLESLRRMIVRDVAAMRREVEAYPDDASLWTLVPGIANSGGTLALHIAGNLRHFVGATLGHTGYVRNRDAEFATRGASRADVAAELADAGRVVHDTLSTLAANQLAELYPMPVLELQVGTGPWLVHLASHVAYHLGQLDYHRRIVSANGDTVGTMSIPEVFAAEDASHA